MYIIVRAQTNIWTDIRFTIIRILKNRQPIIHLLFEVVFTGQITRNIILTRFLNINLPFLLIFRQLILIFRAVSDVVVIN